MCFIQKLFLNIEDIYVRKYTPEKVKKNSFEEVPYLSSFVPYSKQTHIFLDNMSYLVMGFHYFKMK